MNGNCFDITQLDADFHLGALGSRLFLKAPLGVPSWRAQEKRLIAGCLLGQYPDASYEQSVQRLEEKIRHFTGARFCLATASGREAIKLALRGIGVRPGERVVLPSFCCLSVLIPVLELGLAPVFADSGDDWQIDPESVKRVMRPGDRALIVPHLFGRLADLETLQEIADQCGACIIDDAAQAIGLEGSWGKAGKGGDAGIFSFGLFKPLSAMGGGALVSDDADLFQRINQFASGAPPEMHSRKTILKIYGKAVWRRQTYRIYLHWRRRQQKDVGTGQLTVKSDIKVHTISRIDALLAASQLEQVDASNQDLAESASHFARELNLVPFLKTSPSGYMGSPRWVVELVDEGTNSEFYRDLFAHLIRCGIEVQPTYRPLHKYVRDSGQQPLGEFSRGDELSGRLMSLPFSAQTDIRHVTQCLRQFTPQTAKTAGFKAARKVRG